MKLFFMKMSSDQPLWLIPITGMYWLDERNHGCARLKSNKLQTYMLPTMPACGGLATLKPQTAGAPEKNMATFQPSRRLRPLSLWSASAGQKSGHPKEAQLPPFWLFIMVRRF
jgi:hypothetical protein